ncbi:mandelate racemase/muconate lactonizing enzyme family protein [Burkholderia multivorans]|uniref:mandelate racemase/muconate lactonizing enzyme family protein n=1 Tax=Burkholderia multivorans TaxID=87883 RepID=UPI001C211036|nr:mandelate racemase/muconate lactonizing enzyme family protein [Burkholderia multivorans]MBU9670640.1 mandelate racemase/muconate lactonizing enzyme family protein [Burkholderia multivorans]HEF4755599.1 mandelate racemase/muconate lactonizing enzyme family protein [Burkholderia multivorans]
MRIAAIEVIRLSLAFDAGRRPAPTSASAADTYNAADRSLRRMESLLVKVTDEAGRVGWGEAFGHLINPVTFAALEGPVGRWFRGAEFEPTPGGIGALRDAADRALHAFGRTGPVLYALSAIDTALHDLSAQHAGQPLYRWLGARRDEIDVYASLVSYENEPGEVARHVRRAWDEGFRRIKLHETERAAIAAARDALPVGGELMVDVNCPWTANEAVRRVGELVDLGLGWIEEPVWPCDDARAIARVRGTGVRVAAGENASGVAGFRNLFEHDALDVAQPSVAKIGGPTAMHAVIALAAQHRVRVVPHCFYYGAGLLATAHLVATLPVDVALEIPYLDWPERLHDAQRPGARLRLPDMPGLGFVPDDAVLARNTIAHATIC